MDKYQKIYEVLISLLDNMNEESIEDESLYKDIKRLFSVIKEELVFKKMGKEEMKGILMESLKFASSQFLGEFPEKSIKEGIYALLGEEEPNEKFVSIMTEKIKAEAKQRHYNRAKEIIDRVIENEWN